MWAGAQGHGPLSPSHGGQTDEEGLSLLGHGPDIILVPGGSYLCLAPSQQLQLIPVSLRPCFAQ